MSVKSVSVYSKNMILKIVISVFDIELNSLHNINLHVLFSLKTFRAIYVDIFFLPTILRSFTSVCEIKYFLLLLKYPNFSTTGEVCADRGR